MRQLALPVLMLSLIHIWGHGVGQLAERVANGVNSVAYLEVVAADESRGGETAGINLYDGEDVYKRQS